MTARILLQNKLELSVAFTQLLTALLLSDSVTIVITFIVFSLPKIMQVIIFKQVNSIYKMLNVDLGLPPRPPDHPALGPGVPHLPDLYDDVPLDGEVPCGLQPPAQGEQQDLTE